jgi:8-oxo-dGTP pyrophosphatase MutT (NUDIX family)
MEIDETLEEAAARETLEEAGVEVNPDDLYLYAISSLPTLSEIYIAFRGTVPHAHCNSGHESSEAAFYGEADVPWDRLAFPEMGGFLRLFFREFAAREHWIHVSQVSPVKQRQRGYRTLDPVGGQVTSNREGSSQHCR